MYVKSALKLNKEYFYSTLPRPPFPGRGKELFESMVSAQREKCEGLASDDLVVLMTAYKNAKTRNLKKQILSLYAYRYPLSTLKNIHEPYGKLSSWEIKQARSHAKLHGPGTPPEVKTKHRVRIDMGKVDHFLQFVNRPYFYQDVSYGTKILVLDSGNRMEMPNVLRIVTRSTMIEQYVEYCKEQCYEPLSRSTMFKILEVRAASQRKSLQGLDNTAADGAAGFQTLEMLIEALEKGGMKKQWCVDDDFDRAKADILQWKAHIIRSVNEEQAKQDSMKSVDVTSAVIIMGLGHEVSSNEIS